MAVLVLLVVPSFVGGVQVKGLVQELVSEIDSTGISVWGLV